MYASGSAVTPRAADTVRLWYHTLELPEGVTPGWFDLRPVVDKLPWPEVGGSAVSTSARMTGSSPSSSSDEAPER